MTICEKCGGFLPEPGELIRIDSEAPECERMGHKLGCPDGITCIHGQLARSCEVCSLRQQLAESRAELSTAKLERTAARESLRLAEAELERAKARADESERIANDVSWYGKAKKAEARAERLERDYSELIMEVARKFDGETRHQTALRYIREAERADGGPAKEALARKES